MLHAQSHILGSDCREYILGFWAVMPCSSVDRY